MVYPDTEAHWSFAADYAHRQWGAQGPVEFIRLEPDDRRPVGEILTAPATITRLIAFGVPFTEACLDAMAGTQRGRLHVIGLWGVKK